MKNKIRSWANVQPSKGEKNEQKSKTMPDLHNDPRITLENHVRGINPITGAILDQQKYYGDAILPYAKNLTYEELRLKRIALTNQAKELQDKINDEERETIISGNTPDLRSETTKDVGEGNSL